jgi:hypothetical protein
MAGDNAFGSNPFDSPLTIPETTKGLLALLGNMSSNRWAKISGSLKPGSVILFMLSKQSFEI